MATKIIGLIGAKQSGKDTFAERLVSEHGYTRLAFADALKDLALELDPQFPEFLSLPLSAAVAELGWDEAKKYQCVRNYLQTLGVAVREHVGEFAWIQAIAGRVFQAPGPVVITDVRFRNEARFIRANGGQTMRIKRRVADEAVDPHVSERDLDSWITDHIVYNDRTIADLHRTADLFARDHYAVGVMAQ